MNVIITEKTGFPAWIVHAEHVGLREQHSLRPNNNGQKRRVCRVRFLIV